MNHKIIVSIVSGTYNRIASLQKMVQSVRNSIGVNMNYEIVLVDGGSTDGTIEWCKSQPDIKLIEHGELKGAVKAFNDGAYAAKGDYVILANDDIEFVGLTILNAVVYMTEHKNCGMGCFYQDRNNKGWHIELMTGVKNHKYVTVPYGQVCIVPKWLGDMVGWWGDYLKTYGGDNELSCNIYELGFEVEALNNCKIHDRQIEDGLRLVNNIDGAKDPKASLGHHPDSYAWGSTWERKNGFAGPIIPDIPRVDSQTRDIKRILYLPIFEQGWPIQKEQKHGLRDALSKQHMVYEYDYVEMFGRLGNNADELVDDIIKDAKTIKPNIVLTQIHNCDTFKPEHIQKLRDHIRATFINWNGDYYPQNLLDSKDNLGQTLNAQFDIVGLVNRDIIERYKKDGINAIYWQIGFEPDGTIGQPDRFCDVVFLANGYSAERKRLVNEIKRWNYNFDLYGFGWDDALGQTTYNFKDGCKIYRGGQNSIG